MPSALAEREKEGPKKGIYLIRWDLKGGEGEASLISSEVLACECWMSCNPTWPVQSLPWHSHKTQLFLLGRDPCWRQGNSISLCVCSDGACRTLPAKLKTVLCIQRENIQIVFKHGANVIALFVWWVFLFYFLGKSQTLGRGSQLASN